MRWTKKDSAIMAGFGIGGAMLAWDAWRQTEIRRKNQGILANQNVIILGAGFAGISVARELARLLPEDENGNITLVDQNNYLLFTPMLTEVAGGELDPRHIVASPRQLSPRVNFEQGSIQEIDLSSKTVVIKTGIDGQQQRTLKADHLVVALGSSSSYHHVPGAREYSISVKSVQDAAAIRNRILECLEMAAWEKDQNARREVLTFVVAGGGYTGVETMAAINDLARDSARDYPTITQNAIRTVIVEPEKRLLPELSPDLADFAQRKLKERGVEIRLNTKITGADAHSVQLEHGERIPTRLLIWAGGVTPNPIVSKLDCQHSHHGAITVDSSCAVVGHRAVWALGDCAEVPKPDGKGTYTPTAQNATREGTTVARNIVACLRGDQPQPFRYEPIGELALVGKHTGVAKIYGHHFSGLLAWAMWRAIYLAKMPGAAQRSRIAIDWLLDAAFGREITEFPVRRSIAGPNEVGQPVSPAPQQH